MNAQTTAWGVVAKSPGHPVQSKFGGAQLPVTVQVNGSSQQIYVPTGESWENLRVGDHICVEWYNNKWKRCNIQPPELIQALRSRSITPPPVVGAAPPPLNTAPPPISGGTPSRVGVAPPPISNTCPPDVGEWLEIYQNLTSNGVTDAISAANCIFTARRRA